MPLPIAVPVLMAVAGSLSVFGKWIIEIVFLYGRKVAFFAIAIAMFFAVLYAVSTAVFATISSINAAARLSAVSNYLNLLSSVFPSNFFSISALLIAIEFQVFFFRWAIKVLDIKVHFFG